MSRLGHVAVLLVLLLILCWDLLAGAPLPRPFDGIVELIELTFSEQRGQWQVFLFLVSCSILFLAQALLKPRKWYPETSRIADLGLLCFLILVSIHYAITYQISSLSSQYVVLVSAIFLGLLARWLEIANSDIIGLIIVALLIILSISLNEWDFMPRFYFRGTPRATGLWKNPNTYGLLAGAALAFIMSSVLSKGTPCHNRPSIPRTLAQFDVKPMGHWCLMAAGLLAFAALVQSYSRGAWLGTLLALLVCCIGKFRCLLKTLLACHVFNIRRVTLLLLISGVAALIPATDAGPVLRESGSQVTYRLLTFIDPTDRSWRNRVDAWVAAGNMSMDRPLMGWNINQLERTYEMSYNTSQLTEVSAIHLNDWLKISSGIGIPASVTLFLSVSLYARNVMRRRTRLPLIVLATGSIFDGALFTTSLASIFWVLLLNTSPYSALGEDVAQGKDGDLQLARIAAKGLEPESTKRTGLFAGRSRESISIESIPVSKLWLSSSAR